MVKVMELKHVCKSIDGESIVKDLNIDVYKNEILGFIGPNGAGKTTTMRMMFGLITPDSGDISINGYNLKKQFELAIRNIGGMIEKPEMYGYLSGYENLKLYSKLYGDIDDNYIAHIIKILGLENFKNSKFKTYSLGIKQRMGIAQSLLHRPKILVLDEPFNGLDPLGVKEMSLYLKRIAKDTECSIIISSHLIAEVQKICSRVIFINRGVLDMNYSSNQDVEKKHIRFEVNKIERSKEILQESGYTFDKSESLKIFLERQEISVVIKILIENGIEIYSVNPSDDSLENMFFERER